ncbi:uncharacterized protein SCHCODRAFT_01299096 [Schizophyllum commune H4-8]|uniref:uncharacterized protein n=1 Tax=Schizophyllum commune (strain H4-8 / FGSC 9210) TaxID=578458 RepID=UPI00215FC922|nr:uncharacterized protein SCHCODRAFT_01299096 [Schizophyllum commune H4-8]KAI5892102.1 hypothetical protein SCHCODRAFT_01299096 [Schizophyllum commune H4-8]
MRGYGFAKGVIIVFACFINGIQTDIFRDMKATLASLTACCKDTGIARVLQGEPTGCTRSINEVLRIEQRGLPEVPACWAS